MLPKVPLVKPKFTGIARFAPIIGLFIGIFEISILLFLSNLGWPYESLPFIAISINLWLTGGLHFDGLMDTADGIAAGKKKSIEAMKDSRVGAGGVMALTINIALQIAALYKIKLLYIYAIPIACFWGRYSQIIAIGNYPYINSNGFSKFHQDTWGGNVKESIPSVFCIACILSYLVSINIDENSKIFLIIITLIGIIPAILIPNYLAFCLGGQTGDTYGASVILVETFVLTLIAFIIPAS
nr:adenosylcobinamide-GDP ribazoletransferase [Prochlorococcus marinus]